MKVLFLIFCILINIATKVEKKQENFEFTSTQECFNVSVIASDIKN